MSFTVANFLELRYQIKTTTKEWTANGEALRYRTRTLKRKIREYISLSSFEELADYSTTEISEPRLVEAFREIKSEIDLTN